MYAVRPVLKSRVENKRRYGEDRSRYLKGKVSALSEFSTEGSGDSTDVTITNTPDCEIVSTLHVEDVCEGTYSPKRFIVRLKVEGTRKSARLGSTFWDVSDTSEPESEEASYDSPVNHNESCYGSERRILGFSSDTIKPNFTTNVVDYQLSSLKNLSEVIFFCFDFRAKVGNNFVLAFFLRQR